MQAGKLPKRAADGESAAENPVLQSRIGAGHPKVQ